MPGHVVPLDLRDLEGEITVEGMLVGPLRYGAPSLMAAYGRMEATGEQVYVITYEWPDAYTQLDKEATELRHIERFAIDWQKGTGDGTYREAQPGGDPPDFVADIHGVAVGVEVTQLTNEKRRSSAKIFDQVRRGVLKAYQGDFRHLQGHVVYVAFDGKRPSVKDDDVAKVVEAIKKVKPVDEVDMGQDLGEDFATDFEGGLVTAAPVNGLRQTGIAGALGFDIGLAYTSRFTIGEAGEQLTKIVAKKDTPGNDQLLIAVGAPTQDGLSYPSDTVLAHAALEGIEEKAFEAKFLSAVFLHLWDDRAVYRITPGQKGYEHVCGNRPELKGG